MSGESDPIVHDGELSPSIEGFVISEIVSFGTDAAGEIYIVEQGFAASEGEVFKIIPQTPTIPLGDVDCDNAVGTSDLLLLLANWGPCYGCPTDLSGDGSVSTVDLLLLIANWS